MHLASNFTIMRLVLSVFLLSLSFTAVLAQCDTIKVPFAQTSVYYASSEDAGYPATNVVDSTNGTFWRTDDSGFPHYIWIDLGATYNLTGIGIKPRAANTANGKPAVIEALVGFPDTSLTQAAAGGYVPYNNNNDNAFKYWHFGIMPGRYVKLIARTNRSQNTEYLELAELEFYYTTCPNDGKINQVIYWDEQIGKRTTDDAPINLTAFTTSGLPVNYTVVSGPATISGNELSLTGVSGTVEVIATNGGNATYRAADTVFQSFQVIELDDYDPELTVFLTDEVPIEMPTLSTYPISVLASIDETDYLSIEDVTFTVSGGTIDTVFQEGFNAYTAHWTPPAYGNYTVTVTGLSNHNRTTTKTFNVTVTDQIADQDVMVLDSLYISVWQTGQTVGTVPTMPQYVGAYDSIHAQLWITCPSGGCDPWDRAAWVEVQDPSGNWVQIIRYITAYGNECAHNIDVTEYASLLQGKAPMRVHCGTWTGAWEFSLVLEYFKGTPDYKYTRITDIWDGSYPFGNPANLQPVDTVTHRFYTNTQEAKFVLSNTGHGWGDNNSGNAAEFYYANHTVNIGADSYNQYLFNDCDPNPDGCQPQGGSWRFDRAGWCPGAISHPDKYNMNGNLAADTNVTLSYIFEEGYIDYCHPQHPDCESGVTCPNCSGDTQPVYFVDGQIIEYSNTPFISRYQPPVDTTDTTSFAPAITDLPAADVNLYPNPTDNGFMLSFTKPIDSPMLVTISNITGEQFGSYYFSGSQELSAHTFNTNRLSTGMYFVSIYSNGSHTYKKVLVK